MRHALSLLALLATAACTALRPTPPSFTPTRLDAAIPAYLAEHRVAGVGIGVIRDGALVWDGYYGEQAPGIPASARTVFNSASVEKTITAETILALAARGHLDLDAPIATHVKTPDLEGDPRYALLTPRILLSHRSGLLNWPESYDDGRLAFVSDPGARFTYSGAGVELAARYAENKLGRDFEALAFDALLGPNRVEELSMGRLRPWLAGRLAVPMSAQGEYDRELAPRLLGAAPGPWSAADDLLTTVRAYSALLTGILHGPHIPARSTILTSLVGDPIWGCDPTPEVRCAAAYGYAIGWMAYQYGDRTVLVHGGNDAGENALVYYSPETRDGAVIMVNGGNGIFVTVRALELIGDQPDLAAYYRQLVQRHYKVTMTPRV